MAFWLAKKVTVLDKYLDFANIFLQKSANVLSEQTRVNKHAIEFEKDKEPSYGLICGLKPVGFQIFKTYIKTNLANGFIQASKSPASTPIFFICKPNSSLCFYVNY